MVTALTVSAKQLTNCNLSTIELPSHSMLPSQLAKCNSFVSLSQWKKLKAPPLNHELQFTKLVTQLDSALSAALKNELFMFAKLMKHHIHIFPNHQQHIAM